MTYMPHWYLTNRTVLLFIQSVIPMVLLFYRDKKRSWFPARLVLGTAALSAFLFFFVTPLYLLGSSPLAILSRSFISFMAFGCLLLLSAFCFEEQIWTTVLSASTAYILQDMGGSLKTLLRMIPAVQSLASRNAGIFLVDLLCYGTVYLSVFLLFRGRMPEREALSDDRTKAILSLTILLVCIGMARLTQDNADRNQMSILVESLYQILVDSLILLLQSGLMERKMLSSRVEVMRELIHEQKMQYEASKESAQLINEKYHDLKQLLNSFQGTVPQEQLDKLKAQIAAYDRPANSGNEVLDVLLAEKMGLCNQRSIVLTVSLMKTDFSFIEELDLYTLFQNALNNAIAAVSALPEEMDRFISLSAIQEGNILTIHMENPCEENLPFEDGLPVTRQNPDYHGFGMRSMVRIAEKYSGVLTAEQRGRLFFLDIILIDG